jgi:hypothetical protein
MARRAGSIVKRRDKGDELGTSILRVYTSRKRGGGRDFYLRVI